MGARPIWAWLTLDQGSQEEAVVESLGEDGEGPKDGSGDEDISVIG